MRTKASQLAHVHASQFCAVDVKLSSRASGTTLPNSSLSIRGLVDHKCTLHATCNGLAAIFTGTLESKSCQMLIHYACRIKNLLRALSTISISSVTLV